MEDVDRAGAAALLPSAYAPYRDPRDYILSWTDAIWIDRGLGRLTEHYDKRVKVHTAYGETYYWDYVVNNSLQKFAAFPNGGGGHGEDVIWEPRGPNGFISSHRVFKTGTHSGYWSYGPPTGRDWVSRTVAHCLVQDNKVLEEWLVRDEWAVLQALGLDPYAIAAQLAEASPVLGGAMQAGGSTPVPLPDTWQTRRVLACPDQGRRPSVRMRNGEAMSRRSGTRSCSTASALLLTGRSSVTPSLEAGGRDRSLSDRADQPSSPASPTSRLRCATSPCSDGAELGLRIAVIWLMRATYSGVPTYGPVTRTQVNVLGASHYELRDGKILREWRIFDRTGHPGADLRWPRSQPEEGVVRWPTAS